MEKSQKMSFWQVVKRFFEPVRHNYWFVLKPFIRSVWWSLFSIYTVETFKRATQLIQSNDYNGLLNIISIFCIVLIFYCVVNYFARNV
jgi:hypothetical protein